MAEKSPKDGLREIECKYHSPAFLALEWPKCDCMYRIDDKDNAGFCKRPEFYRCIKEVGKMPVPLSYSSVSNFLTCPMLYYLKDIRGISVRPSHTSSALKMGKLWDCAKQRLLGEDIDMGAVVEEYEINDMDIAKVRAINRAYKTLEIGVDPKFTLQAEFNNEIVADGIYEDMPLRIKTKGFYDRKYADHFCEDKLSSRPDNYLDPWFIQSQVGAYFLADPAMEYCIMEVVRTPDLRSTGKFKDEGPEGYEERCYQDIISRPSFYFIGFDREKKRYGKKYYRSEFDLDSIKDRFRIISVMIRDCQGFDGWYRSDRMCNNVLPGIQCDMKQVCRLNSMSEDIYTIKQRKELFI